MRVSTKAFLRFSVVPGLLHAANHQAIPTACPAAQNGPGCCGWWSVSISTARWADSRPHEGRSWRRRSAGRPSRSRAWYLPLRRRLARSQARTTNRGSGCAHQAFVAPRFLSLYRAWLLQGDAVLGGALSPILADARAGGASGPDDDATLYAPESGSDRRRDSAVGCAGRRAAWRYCGDGRALDVQGPGINELDGGGGGS